MADWADIIMPCPGKSQLKAKRTAEAPMTSDFIRVFLSRLKIDIMDLIGKFGFFNK